MTKNSNGFTIIELIFFIILAGATSVIFFVQKNNIEVTARDNARKVAINAVYYGLEKVFYPANKYYPQTINSDILKTVDPELFKDSNGVMIDTTGSQYTYEPTGCVDKKCTGYTLKTTLEKEADYVKTNAVKTINTN